MLELVDAGYTYPDGSVRALTGVNLHIETGEFVAVIGANGSGKSTLARLCNGLFLPTEGEVLVGGRPTSDAAAMWEARRRVGVVFQNPDNQLVAATVEEEVAFGPENLGVSPDDIGERVEQALASVGLADQRRRPPHLLSGGQKQLVAIAAVLAMHPDVVVLDEATAMLDPQGRARLMDTVFRLCQERQVTIMHITHHLEEIIDAHRVIALAEGRVAYDGEPDALLADDALLTQLGLDVPPVVRIGRRLADGGAPVSRVTPRLHELVAQLVVDGSCR